MKRALCTGINDYPGTANDLSGCVNDANDWKNYLTNIGFDVTTLLDNQVTINNFIDAIQTILQTSNSGDVVVITYSGHGTQVYDTSGDEQDGYDEALYLYDGILKDDTMRQLLDNAKPGVHVFLVIDSCFSGTVTRKLADPDSPLGKPRFIKICDVPVNVKPHRAFIGEEGMPEILLTGCSDTEYSYDAYINGRWNGAMTYHAIKSLKENQKYSEFHATLRSKLPSYTYPQTPQLEGKEENKQALMFEPFGEQPPASNDNNGCLLAFLPKLFSSKKKTS